IHPFRKALGGPTEQAVPPSDVISFSSSLLPFSAVAPSTVPPMKPWWKEIVVLGTVGCASVAFLLLMVIICYKAIKRKPLRKEENGTSRGEYAMSSRSKKTVDTNNTGV
uniref:Proline rich membrane anchor 1 n=1 Tax=Oncorhynchus tshawytscha TaxID=74940 RepID=A0AAZ3QBX9_ONCTS